MTGRFKASGGWVKIPMDGELQKILTKIGMKDKQLGHGSAWVPKWVKESIALYRKGDGFAGLSLAEFLVSMRPSND